MASFDPTAANVIASLGVKGATVGKTTGSEYQGYVPVLDENGKLSASLIPADAALDAIPPLSNVVYVDPRTTVDAGSQKGSVLAPFSSLATAAQKFVPTDSAKTSGYITFVLAPGKYDDNGMTFPSERRPSCVSILSLGECLFAAGTFTISNLADRSMVVFRDITTSASTNVIINAASDVYVVGRSYIRYLKANDGSNLSITAESKISEIGWTVATTYLANDKRIENTSCISGETVRDALDNIGTRTIVVSDVKFDSGSKKFTADSTKEISESGNAYDLSAHDKILVEGINALFADTQDLNVNSINADTLTVDTANISTLNITALKLGGYKITIDTYGYLVVMDASEESVQPPEKVVMLYDSADQSYWTLGVENGGRLYVTKSDEGDASQAEDSLTVYEDDTKYSLSMNNRRLSIKKLTSEE